MSDNKGNPANWQPTLLPGEEILWQGRPAPGVMLRWADIYVIPFSIFWLGGVLSMLFVPGHNGVWFVPVPSTLILIPFIIFGLHITAGRFVLEYWQLRRTRYFITGRRIHILTKTLLHYHDYFIAFSQIQLLDKSVNQHDFGSIAFEAFVSGRLPFGLYRLEGASKVYELLLQKTTRSGVVPRNFMFEPVTVSRLDAELLPGETILWRDKPVAGWIFGLKDIIQLPVSLIVGAINVGAGAGWYLTYPDALHARLPGTFWMTPFWRYFGIIAILVGLYAMFGQYIHRYIRKRHIEYAITNRRVLAMYDADGCRVWSLPLSGLPAMKKHLSSITFAPKLLKPVPVIGRGKVEVDIFEVKPGFYGIRDSMRVYNLIRLAIRMQQPVTIPK